MEKIIKLEKEAPEKLINLQKEPFIPAKSQKKTIDVNFSTGDMIISPDSGDLLLSEVNIIKPTNLVPSNIKEGENIAGIEGSLHIDIKQSKNIIPNFSEGNITIIPDDEYDSLSQVIINKPNNLIPENIVEDIDIGGVVGSRHIITTENVIVDADFSDGNMSIEPQNADAIESALVRKPSTLIAENVKKDIEIAGLTGTYEATYPELENPASEADILNGKQAIDESGEVMTGTLSLDPVEVPEKDVIFIDDYAQRVCYSYTAEEFLALTEMPPNPSHDGIVAKGWNWSFEDAQDYVRKYDQHVIGQKWETADGKSHMKVNIYSVSSLTYGVHCASAEGTIIVDWGDGTSDIVNSSGMYNTAYHTYVERGIYEITFAPESEEMSYTFGSMYGIYDNGVISGVETLEILCGRGSSFPTFSANYSKLSNLQRIITNGQKIPNFLNVFKGRFLTISSSNYSVYIDGNTNLQYLSMAKDTTIAQNGLRDVMLRRIAFPETVTTIFVQSDFNLTVLIIPENITSFNNLIFGGGGGIDIYLCKEVYFKGDVTAFTVTNMFNQLKLKLMDFTHCTSVPTLASSRNIGIAKDGVIRVPAALEEEWKVATNWTVVANNIVGV